MWISGAEFEELSRLAKSIEVLREDIRELKMKTPSFNVYKCDYGTLGRSVSLHSISCGDAINKIAEHIGLDFVVVPGTKQSVELRQKDKPKTARGK